MAALMMMTGLATYADAQAAGQLAQPAPTYPATGGQTSTAVSQPRPSVSQPPATGSSQPSRLAPANQPAAAQPLADQPPAGQPPADQALTPTFKTKIDLVSVTAVVRDSKGRVVRNLAQKDFEVYEKGKSRPIVDFKVSDQGPVSMAILFDVSGSMRVSANLEAGKRAVEHILSWVQPKADEIALFSFDKDIRQEVAFTSDPNRVRAALNNMTAIGMTSLYDAIAQTAKTLGNRPSPRRAVVVITDGIDTSSSMKASEVSAIASAIDVPVYVIAVVSPLDHPGEDQAVVSALGVSTNLQNLAYWTGGDLTLVSTPAHASLAARELITELRHQYLIAFESSKEPGWYSLDVRTRRRELTVRARSGYFASQPKPFS
jgi:VWFA-related protein